MIVVMKLVWKLYFSRQINTAIGREKDRVKRFYVASPETNEKIKKLFQDEINLTPISAKNLDLLRKKWLRLV